MTPDEITFAFISLTAIVIGWRNPTTVALALSFLVPKAIMLIWGWGFGVEGAFYVDLAIITAIYTLKQRTPHPFCRMADKDNGHLYRSFPRQLCGMWLERSPWDRFVLLCFPAAWWFYGVLNESVQWWGLIIVWLAQLTASFWEAVNHRLSLREANAVSGASDDPRSGVEFAWARYEGGGYG